MIEKNKNKFTKKEWIYSNYSHTKNTYNNYIYIVIYTTCCVNVYFILHTRILINLLIKIILRDIYGQG